MGNLRVLAAVLKGAEGKSWPIANRGARDNYISTNKETKLNCN